MNFELKKVSSNEYGSASKWFVLANGANVATVLRSNRAFAQYRLLRQDKPTTEFDNQSALLAFVASRLFN